MCSTVQLSAQRFYADDPIWVDPDNAVNVGDVPEHSLSDYYDFILHSFSRPGDPERIRAVNINTLGEVPDSSWFENRHGLNRMTIDQLARGPDQGDGPAPDGVWIVTEAKTEGITPGFRIQDVRGDIYIIKFDPPENPEMATAAEVISTKFLYAMGYHVPENYLVDLDRTRLRVDPGAMVEDEFGRERPMTDPDLDEILERTHRSEDGTYRAIASKFLSGRTLGPFAYVGTRPDDPNDVFPHENRRELRGLRVLASWLNHDDYRAINSQDSVVTEGGATFIRHHLIDFGSTLGSGSVGMQKHRAGWEYIWEPKTALARIVTLGLWDREWIRIRYPDLPSVGRFESEKFEPEEWKPEYPNPAFLRADTEDTYWGAKIAMAFTNAEIRKIVQTGKLSDSGAEAYLIQRLIERRDKIGNYWFSLVHTADNFEVTSQGTLGFERLASRYGFDEQPEDTGVTWFRFDHQTGVSTPLGDGKSVHCRTDRPAEAVRTSANGRVLPSTPARSRPVCGCLSPKPGRTTGGCGYGTGVKASAEDSQPQVTEKNQVQKNAVPLWFKIP